MLSSLLTSILSGEASNAVKRTRAAIIAYALIGVCAVLAAGFLLAALFIWLSRRFGTLETAIGFGLGFLLLAALVWLVSWLVARSRRKKRAAQQRAELATLAAVAAVGALPGLMNGRSMAGILGLPIIGLIAAEIYKENFGRKADADAEDGSDLGDD